MKSLRLHAMTYRPLIANVAKGNLALVSAVEKDNIADNFFFKENMKTRAIVHVIVIQIREWQM